MQEFIARANIEKYRTLLAGPLDAATREEVERLLSEELANQPRPKRAKDLGEPVPPKSR